MHSYEHTYRSNVSVLILCGAALSRKGKYLPTTSATFSCVCHTALCSHPGPACCTVVNWSMCAVAEDLLTRAGELLLGGTPNVQHGSSRTEVTNDKARYCKIQKDISDVYKINMTTFKEISTINEAADICLQLEYFCKESNCLLNRRIPL